MSSNFFAALDDSGDESPTKAVKNTAVKKDVKKTDATKPVEASKVDPRRRPNQHDRNTKHGRGGRAPPRDGKRQYDRRSGTGRGKEIKKDGGGARNWGSDKNEAKKMEGTINEDEVVAEEEPKTEDAPAIEEEPEPEPEEDHTMTLAEYMASKEKKEENTGREVENEFKGFSVASKKEEEDFLVMGGGKQKKVKKKKEEQKKAVDVGFRVANPNSGRGEGRGEGRGDGRGRGRGGRDGRGRGGRDGRGRGARDGRDGRGRGGRGPKSGGFKSDGLNVQDENAFPSL